jgi:serine/threonine protein kinase
MSTQVFTLDDLNVESALGLDPCGSVFQGTERSTGSDVIILGVVPASKQKLTATKLQQSLRGVLNITHERIAPITAYGVLSEEQAHALQLLTAQLLSDTSDQASPLPQAYIAYRVQGTCPLQTVIAQFDEPARIKIFHELLSGVGSLHNNRINHLALSPHALWWTDEGLLITHSGVSSLMKKGLSLSRDQSEPDPHIIARLPYVSPEEIAGKLTHQSCDLYAASAIMHEYLNGPLVSPDLTVIDVIEQIKQGLHSSVSAHLSEPWRDLFKRGLGLSVRERFTSASRFLKAVDDCGQHPLHVSEVLEDQVITMVGVTADTRDVEGDEIDQDLDGTVSEQSSIKSVTDLMEGDGLHENLSASTLESDLGAINEALQELDQMKGGEDANAERIDLITKATLIPSQSAGASDEEIIFETIKDLSPIVDGIRGDKDPAQQILDDDHLEEALSIPAQSQEQTRDIIGSTQQEQRSTELQDPQPHTFESSAESKDLPEEPIEKPMEFAVQSLRSKMSKTPSSSRASTSSSRALHRESHLDDIGEMAFGAPDSDMAFGFSQDDVGEHTFLEFSDIDEQTLFEEDLDAAVQASHKTMMGMPAAQEPAPRLEKRSTPNNPPMMTAVGIPYQAVPDIPGPNSESPDLQSPDFLSDFQSDVDPSRVLPIPGAIQSHQEPRPISIPNASLLARAESTPLPETSTPVGYAPPYVADPSSFPQGLAPEIPATPSTRSSLNAAAHDWPVNEAESYKPPTQDVNVMKMRQAPRLQEKRSLSSKITSWLVLTVMIVGGGVGIYWASSHWDQIAIMIAVESAESINISTTPSNMSVRVDQNSPLSTPAIFNYDGQHSVGDELRLKFMWKPGKLKKSRKRRRRRKRKTRFTIVDIKAQVLSGNSNLYFIGGKPGEKYAQSLIISQGESLQVTLQDPSLGQTPLGQTPLIIIGPNNRELTLQIQGTSIKREVKLGQPQDAKIVIESEADSAP